MGVRNFAEMRAELYIVRGAHFFTLTVAAYYEKKYEKGGAGIAISELAARMLAYYKINEDNLNLLAATPESHTQKVQSFS
jgi:hypothetical protein